MQRNCDCLFFLIAPGRDSAVLIGMNGIPGLPEILAPAGGREQFFAALGAGADAVYLGLKGFNARARAENFTLEDLRELVPLARTSGMRVLVATNVVLKQDELPLIMDAIAELDWIGVHALIIQDLGLARTIRERMPWMRMHASTQLAVHNEDGAAFAADMGFKRVVLARELTARDISRIKEAVGDRIELEVFCHGSLCYSYSGLCFFSGAEDARSGNRGECAYTCRKPYRIVSEPGYGFLFSMKDLATSDHVDALLGAGVSALKIEGRKKDAQYVASSVGLYKQARDRALGEASGAARNFSEDLKSSYQRDTTSFFVKGRYHENVIDLDNAGHRGTRIGVVQSAGKGWMEVTTSEPLDLFDGLRVDSPDQVYHALPQQGQNLRGSVKKAQAKYENEICQFSLREMQKGSKRMTTALAGDHLRIQIPSDARVKEGDVVFRVRSNELKRYVDSISSESGRLRSLYLMRMLVSIQDGPPLQLRASLFDHSGEIVSASIQTEASRPRGTSTLAQDLRETFALLGDAGVECDVEVEGDPEWFVPRSKIKELKRMLSSQALQSMPAILAARKRDARPSSQGSAPVARATTYQIKVDRLEYLSALDQILTSHPGLVDEIIFEPKKSNISKSSPTDVFASLRSVADKHSVHVRFAIPVVIRSWDEGHLRAYVNEYVLQGGSRFEVANVGAFKFLQDHKIALTDLASDFTLYALNSQSVLSLHELGCNRVALSVEDDWQNLQRLLAQWPHQEILPQAILYKDTPLFIAEACSLTALHNGCPTSKVCGYRTLEIENDEGDRFFVAHEQCKSIVFGKNAYSISGRRSLLEGAGVHRFRLDFLTRLYSKEDILRIANLAFKDQQIANTHPANFHRKLL
ncbi:MAG TPA: U32 family peptidase [Leptospiraceae bacterium]|nr:U32 family peptidase [Leptospiraceae bacterium]